MDQLTFDSPDRPTAPLWSAGPRRRSSRLYEAEGRPVEVVEARRAQPPTMHGHHLPLCKASLCVPLMQQHAPRALPGLCSARGRRCPQQCSPTFGAAAYATHIDIWTRRCDPGSSPGRAEPPRSQASVGEQPLLGPRRGCADRRGHSCSPTVEAAARCTAAALALATIALTAQPCPRGCCHPHRPCFGRCPLTRRPLSLAGRPSGSTVGLHLSTHQRERGGHRIRR